VIDLGQACRVQTIQTEEYCRLIKVLT
jgi:hypothetical protein